MKKFLFLFFGILLLWSLFPILWQLSLSFDYPIQIYSTPAPVIPPSPTLDSYLRALGLLHNMAQGDTFGSAMVGPFLSGMQNSMIVAVAVTLITMVACVPAGYAF